MASFEKVNGKWRAHVSLCTAGQRRKVSKTFTTKAAAKSWALVNEQKLKMSEGLIRDNLTFGDLFDHYAEKVSSKKKGRQWEEVRLRLFKRYPLANVMLVESSLVDIETFVDSRLSRVKASSVNRELNLLRHCITKAQNWKWLARSHNPMDGLERPKNPPPRNRRIRDDEIETLCLVLGYHNDMVMTEKSQEVAVAWLIAIETAMRASEIVTLCPAFVSFDRGVAHLPDTKNGSQRNVPLSPKAIALIRQLPFPDDPYTPIFSISAASLSTLFRKYRQRADIHDLTFHDSRHEAITRLAEEHDPYELARIVGHKNIQELLTYYNKSAEDIAKKMASKSVHSSTVITASIEDTVAKMDQHALSQLIATLATALTEKRIN